MGSSIHLVSTVGQGSTFSFSLILKHGTAQASRPAQQPEGELKLNGLRVLVAEDNALNMEILKTFLEDMDCRVDCACNGSEAVEKFRASPEGYYRVVFMDVMMPVMDRSGRHSCHPHPASEGQRCRSHCGCQRQRL